MDLGFRLPRLSRPSSACSSLAVPGVATAGITQINLFIGTMIASMSDSAVSYLYYADRINQLPLGIVGIAIGVVLLPELTQKLAAGNGVPRCIAITGRWNSRSSLRCRPRSHCGGPGADHSGAVSAGRLFTPRTRMRCPGRLPPLPRTARFGADPRLPARLLCTRGHAHADDLCRLSAA